MLTNRTYKTYVRDYSPIYITRESSIWGNSPEAFVFLVRLVVQKYKVLVL